VAFVRAAIPELRKTHGRIIFTSSGAAMGAYSTWGAYGAAKAAMNHLAMTLEAEEPLITSISIRPGVVDTQMQQAIREVHLGEMDKKDAEKFKSLHKEGGLLRPEQPGHVMAKLAVDGPKELSGKFLRYVYRVFRARERDTKRRHMFAIGFFFHWRLLLTCSSWNAPELAQFQD